MTFDSAKLLCIVPKRYGKAFMYVLLIFETGLQCQREHW